MGSAHAAGGMFVTLRFSNDLWQPLVRNEQQYVRLAESFLIGKHYFTSIPSI
jgi:hypothetical protein